MRIGIMGGTMDPVHDGHIAAANMAKEALALDEMILLPAGNPPHKETHADKWHRLEMARLAARSAGMRCSDMETRREGITYSVDTLTRLTRERPNDEIFYVVGGDMAHTIEQWRDFPRAATMCTFAMVDRGCEAQLSAQLARISERTGARFAVVPGEGPEISSTEIRKRVDSGESLRGLVPEAVADYIEAHGLYRRWTVDEMCDKLRGMIPPKRFQHSIGVMETAVRLAEVAGADVEKARVAGLLHDCAKRMDSEQMLEAARMGGIALMDDERENEAVLHAPAGAFVARHEFGVNDREILSAIRLHTAGAPGMTPLEALIYVSDYIEPNRKNLPGLEEIRIVAQTDIHRAAMLCGLSTRAHVKQMGYPFFRQTEDMLRHYAALFGET